MSRRGANFNHVNVVGVMDNHLFGSGDDPHAPIPFDPFKFSPKPISPPAQMQSTHPYGQNNTIRTYDCDDILTNALQVTNDNGTNKINNSNHQVLIDLALDPDSDIDDMDDDLSAAEFYPEPRVTQTGRAINGLNFFDDDLSLQEFEPLSIEPSSAPKEVDCGNQSFNNMYGNDNKLVAVNNWGK